MPTKIAHLCLSVRGALKNWTPGDFVNLVRRDDGRWATPAEAKDFLLDELSKGHEVIPFGEPCEGFDYSGGGCPGHVEGSAPEESP
jgi:hypothetical protein